METIHSEQPKDDSTYPQKWQLPTSIWAGYLVNILRNWEQPFTSKDVAKAFTMTEQDANTFALGYLHCAFFRQLYNPETNEWTFFRDVTLQFNDFTRK